MPAFVSASVSTTGDAVGAHARHEGFIGRVEVALVDDEDGGCAELAQVFDKVALTLIEVPGVGDDKRDVDPFEHGPGAFDSGESESADIVDAAVSMKTTGPIGASSHAFSTGSVVVPATSETIEIFWLVSALMRELLPALRLPKRPM